MHRNVDVRDNYHLVLDKIEKAARSTGRDLEDILLVVVTKTHPVEIIQAAIEAGARNLGENYVEDAIPKIHALCNAGQLNWHMVGHVQSRKAVSVCKYFQYLHSLDSVKLAEKMSRTLIEFGKSLPVWFEINVGGEESKSGWNIEDKAKWKLILVEIERIIALPGINPLGCMTIPPFSTDPETSRTYYRKLRKFQEYVINELQLSGFRELSIGMSGDFEVAIQEGSTCVRIGQAIFGPRIIT